MSSTVKSKSSIPTQRANRLLDSPPKVGAGSSLLSKLLIYIYMQNSQVYIYSKGAHLIEAVEIGELAKIQGVRGWIDAIELMTLLLENGYNFIK